MPINIARNFAWFDDDYDGIYPTCTPLVLFTVHESPHQFFPHYSKGSNQATLPTPCQDKFTPSAKLWLLQYDTNLCHPLVCFQAIVRCQLPDSPMYHHKQNAMDTTTVPQ